MKDFGRVLLVAVAIVVGNFAGTVYNGVVLPQDVGVAISLRSYSTKVLVDTPDRIDISTGNLISSEHVLTNWHALRSLRNGCKLLVELADGSTVPAKVLKSDQEKDLALLKLVRPTLLPYIRLAIQEPTKGDPITIRGFSKGVDYRQVVGKVVGWRSASRTGADIIFLLDCQTVGGMSGSAATNQSDHLAGVLFGCRDNSANCISIKAVKEFLKGTEFPL